MTGPNIRNEEEEEGNAEVQLSDQDRCDNKMPSMVMVRQVGRDTLETRRRRQRHYFMRLGDVLPDLADYLYGHDAPKIF